MLLTHAGFVPVKIVSPTSDSRPTMRRKTAFNQSHFWENIGLFLFVVAGLVGLWYVINNVLSW